MKNKLRSTFPLFVFACVLFMAAPSQASPITYDVTANYEGGYTYQFAFIVSEGVATFDDSTEDMFFKGDDKWDRKGSRVIDALSYNPSDPGSLVFNFDVDFQYDFLNQDFKLFLFAADRVTSTELTVNVFDLSLEDSFLDTIEESISAGGAVVTARPTAAAPEPATLSLIALGVAGLVFLRRRTQPQLEHVIPHGTNAANA